MGRLSVLLHIKLNTMKKHLLLLLLTLLIGPLSAQPREIKNVIVMIPDGASTNLLSISRWYQYYLNNDKTRLAIDPYLCGVVKTHSSDAPIGDSAPTTSCYMTGQPTQTGFVSMYPLQTPNDLVTIDPDQAYQPMASLLEAAKLIKGKSTGLVFTCEFPHATPADCAAHWYRRSHYDVIGKQMLYNNIDVLIGGGNKFFTPQHKSYLLEQEYQVVQDDIAALRACREGKLWALFEKESLPYEIDRDTAITPSLAEMTRKAITLLSQNENGFFLMVEGSKIDWAAHDNDGKTMITEFLAFDEAVKEALSFANRDGKTVVVILPDHGTGGISLGNRNANWGYDRLTLDTLMKPLTEYTASINKMVPLVKKAAPESLDSLFQQYYNITLTEFDRTLIHQSRDYDLSPLHSEEREKNYPLVYNISTILYDRTYIGFTTYGHTGEDVFLAVYHPYADIPTGMHTNIEINSYLCRQLGIAGHLPELTQKLFTPHHILFQEIGGVTITIDSVARNQYILTAKRGKDTMVIESNTNYILFNKEKIELNSLMIYVDINKTFYLPERVKHFWGKR